MKAGSPEIGLLVGGSYSNYRRGGRNRDKSHERVEEVEDNGRYDRESE
jgi:hypothetical protein